MGGVSRSAFSRRRPASPASAAVVSLEHGGGFASVRTRPQAWATAGAQAFVLRCRGDGRQYKFTVRMDDGFDGVQYQARFAAAARANGPTVDLPVTEFAASFRGRPVPGAPVRSIRRISASSG